MYVFIVNNTSGKRIAYRLWSEVEEILREKKLRYEVHVSNSIEQTNAYMTNMLATETIVAFGIIGGDGTISSVIQQLAYSGIPIAILPAGSGNDVCRNFKLSTDPKRFVHDLIGRKTTLIDLLHVNGKYGVTVAGIGLDAVIGNRADNSLYKKWLNKVNRGSTAYTIAAIIELLFFKPFTGKLVVDGQPVMHTSIWLVANGNVRIYGGGLTICPTADPTDGMIDITVLHDAKRWKVMTKLFPALLLGEPIIQQEVSYMRGKDILLAADRLLSYVIDGEIYQSNSVRISIKPKALEIILPQKQ